jgi:hypothetical protein
MVCLGPGEDGFNEMKMSSHWPYKIILGPGWQKKKRLALCFLAVFDKARVCFSERKKKNIYFLVF